MEKPCFSIRHILATALCAACAMIAHPSLHAQSVIYPSPVHAGHAHAASSAGGDTLTLSNNLFSASFINTDGHVTFGGCKQMGLKPGSELFYIVTGDGSQIPASAMTLTSWHTEPLAADANAAVGSRRLEGESVTATFSHGDLEMEWRAILRDGSHYLRTELTIKALADVAMHSITAMAYKTDASATPAVVGNTRGAVLASDAIFAGLETPTAINSATDGMLRGLWSRHTTLEAGKSWNISSVVGMIAPGQARRSFLAYSERERAVPWRAFPHYNSWYELNIDRNNSPTYANHMTTDECVDVIGQWRTNLSERHGADIKAFVWDDGWDSYGTWTFNPHFPNGFAETDKAARAMNAGIGGWLGPVGGYGASGDMRRAYWSDNGGMQLSNPAYYKVFLDACRHMIDNYDFRFFKLDGISAQFSSTGPDEGTTGEENAEGIINILSEVRKMRPDMFFNTTVGTWASPFWFHFTDAVWRQEADWATIGDQGDDRERWITYRDRLVYQNFVQNSPLCPINMLMTHGVILTRKGDVSKSMDYDGIVRELRCAFACGSGMVELYCDSELLNAINGGALWGDVAECIKWQEKNADVLPDIHWVGGNPWNGTSAEVYGWASWNGQKATLALRNPAASESDYTFTLRQALEIPSYITDDIHLLPAFANQPALRGLETDKAVGLDTPLTVTLPASSLYVFDGAHRSAAAADSHQR